MAARTQAGQRWRLVGIVVGASVLFGMVFGFFQVDNPAEDRTATLLAIGRGAWTGAVIAGLLSMFEAGAVAFPAIRRSARPPFLALLLYRSLLYLLVIVGGLWSGAAIFHITEAPPIGWNSTTYWQVGASATAGLAFNFLFMINRLLGPAVFRNFLTGRYHHPRIEHRVLLFADLVGSTAIAERIGDLEFHRFLNAVYGDLTRPVIATGGAIHKYVGDEMIVSWPDMPSTRIAALRCGLDAIRTLAEARTRYRGAFGAEPAIRVAVHAGPVVAGEMGDVKQEIVYLGDAMNTAARLVDCCRTLDRPLIASGELLDGLALPAGLDTEPMGETTIRGKSRPMALYALTGGGGGTRE
ncbi:MAG: adenylate/guanylate cyclase domain-containing protein [Pseudomonadota bacterium]|nr:adenylate/guanylate cyclase domain-containing protein [Pseudomonadota bacterium]